MLQKCVILGLLLLLVGGLTIGWVYNATRTEETRAPADGAKYSLGPEEYLDKYGRWYRLSPEQQNELVLELDKDRQNKSSTSSSASKGPTAGRIWTSWPHDRWIRATSRTFSTDRLGR